MLIRIRHADIAPGCANKSTTRRHYNSARLTQVVQTISLPATAASRMLATSICRYFQRDAPSHQDCANKSTTTRHYNSARLTQVVPFALGTLYNLLPASPPFSSMSSIPTACSTGRPDKSLSAALEVP